MWTFYDIVLVLDLIIQRIDFDKLFFHFWNHETFFGCSIILSDQHHIQKCIQTSIWSYTQTINEDDPITLKWMLQLLVHSIYFLPCFFFPKELLATIIVLQVWMINLNYMLLIPTSTKFVLTLVKDLLETASNIRWHWVDSIIYCLFPEGYIPRSQFFTKSLWSSSFTSILFYNALSKKKAMSSCNKKLKFDSFCLILLLLLGLISESFLLL